MFRQQLQIWWLRQRIRRRNALIEDMKDFRASTAIQHHDINIYLFELRDRNSIDHSRIATLTYLGEKNHAHR